MELAGLVEAMWESQRQAEVERDAEQAAHSRWWQFSKQRKSLVDQAADMVRSGQTTGDELLDFCILVFGDNFAARYRELSRFQQGITGAPYQLVLAGGTEWSQDSDEIRRAAKSLDKAPYHFYQEVWLGVLPPMAKLEFDFDRLTLQVPCASSIHALRVDDRTVKAHESTFGLGLKQFTNLGNQPVDTPKKEWIRKFQLLTGNSEVSEWLDKIEAGGLLSKLGTTVRL